MMIAGIDLGTTHSLIGCMDAGFPVLIADENGARLTPSVVSFLPEDEVLVGAPALRLRVLKPERTIYSVKRLMGRRVGEADVEGLDYALGGAEGSPVTIPIDGVEHRPEQVSSLILKKLKADAERALGCAVDRAVITVPAYFNDAQRNATIAAGELAGFVVERIVSEPTAAALAYGLDRLGESSRVAVYDFGGGTFDISILEIRDGVFQVLSTNGNTRLGGDDIDQALASWIRERLLRESRMMPETLDDPLASARLLEAAREAKIRLSTQEETSISLPFLSENSGGDFVLTREMFERVARPVIERTRSHCRRALSDAATLPGELQAVVLVGGSTRIPLVRQMVAEEFGREPDLSQNPDEAVAIGATLQAGILSGAVTRMVLLDVTPLSLGIETFGGLMNVIIPRNTTIPARAGELFTNPMANQNEMLIHVLQGERELAKDNWSLGRFPIPFEAAARGQARVGVQFSIDANGILQVLARDTATGNEQVVEMKSVVDVDDAAVEEMIAGSVEHAFEDMNARIFTEAAIKAGEMLPAIESALAAVGHELSAEETDGIQTLSAEVRQAMESGDARHLKERVKALDEATQTLATLLMEKAMETALADKQTET